MEPAETIAYQPTDGLSYDPSEPKYWDPEALEKEIRRTFEICHGCRLCFKYCDSFPNLFTSIDGKDGDVGQITSADTAKVMDSCFQSKLCEVQWPYSERDGHEFRLDFPSLVHRYVAQKARRDRHRVRRHLPWRSRSYGCLRRAVCCCRSSNEARRSLQSTPPAR